MTNPNFASPERSTAGDADATPGAPPCLLVINAIDPSGGSGLTADTLAIASVGAHALPVVTGAYVRDTTEILDFVAFDEEGVTDQARTVMQDVAAQVIKVGFAGSPESLGVIAELATDYADLPLIAYMPNLSWWHDDKIDAYQDAFRELLLPQTTVLIGNHSTLWRWLLPDWSGSKPPGPRDLARAAADMGTPYTLVTGIPLPEQQIDNVLASPHAVLASESFERIEATFTGAGETLSAALAALLACGCDLAEAASEALLYLDHCLDAGFRPGMGHVLPDRLFWAEPDAAEGDDDTPSAPDIFQLPIDDTKH